MNITFNFSKKEWRFDLVLPNFEDRRLPSLGFIGESELGKVCFIGVVGGDEEEEVPMVPLISLVPFDLFSSSSGTTGGEPFTDWRGLLTKGVCVEGVDSDWEAPGTLMGGREATFESFTGTIGKGILGGITGSVALTSLGSIGAAGRSLADVLAGGETGPSCGDEVKGTAGVDLATGDSTGPFCDTGDTGTTAVPLGTGESDLGVS